MKILFLISFAAMGLFLSGCVTTGGDCCGSGGSCCKSECPADCTKPCCAK